MTSRRVHAARCAEIVLVGFGCLVFGAAIAAGEIAVKARQRIVFLGDSITRDGAGPTGYVTLTAAGLKAIGIPVEAIGAGVGGNRAPDMLARLDKDVLSKKPDWMTLSCGVNDISGVPLETYKADITAIVDKAQAARVKVLILTATVFSEKLDSGENRKLDGYNDFLRALAKEKHCLLADPSADFHRIIAASGNPGSILTRDGIHMNPRGDQVMALSVLRGFGLTDAQLKKAAASWPDPAKKR